MEKARLTLLRRVIQLPGFKWPDAVLDNAWPIQRSRQGNAAFVATLLIQMRVLGVHERPPRAYYAARRKRRSSPVICRELALIALKTMSSYIVEVKVSFTTRCSLLPTFYGTRTAKLFAATNANDQLLKNTFWPDHVTCRVWESSPPCQKQANLLI